LLKGRKQFGRFGRDAGGKKNRREPFRIVAVRSHKEGKNGREGGEGGGNLFGSEKGKKRVNLAGGGGHTQGGGKMNGLIGPWGERGGKRNRAAAETSCSREKRKIVGARKEGEKFCTAAATASSDDARSSKKEEKKEGSRRPLPQSLIEKEKKEKKKKELPQHVEKGKEGFCGFKYRRGGKREH